MRIAQIDAFTDSAFHGNPAAVCVVTTYPEAREMQILAREMNLSETAFLRPSDDGYELRWFTPTVEVDLCGHATLAASHFLWESGQLELGSEARFRTRSGLLTAVRMDRWIEMDFPAQPAVAAEPVGGLLQAVGAHPRFVGRNESDWLIEVESEQEVLDLDPDIRRLGEICERGVMVTSLSNADRFDFVSRFFAPAAGVAEDPVTGSAHCCLGPYWARRLNKVELVGFQASARGGVVRTRIADDRVVLGGQAVTVMQGELTVSWPRVE
jgi:predicted PhzF superfamily epimerase YddE/YHI9